MMDLLIKKAKLLDGASCNIAIDKNKIIDICDEELDENNFKCVIDMKHEHYISAGWIDSHTHCFNRFKLYSDDADLIGYKSGVTTVVDAGTTGAENIEDFYLDSIKSKTNVYAFINISKIGIRQQNELSDLNNIDKELLMLAIEKYNSFIVGIKVRLSKSVVGNNGVEPLKKAREISQQLGLPIMVHIGSEPPTLLEVLKNLKSGDIVSHIFNGKKNGIIGNDGKVKPEVIESKNRGIVFDIAHGKDSFNFKVAEIANVTGLKSDIISTDIYKYNRINGPVFNLATTMNKVVYLGYSIEDVIKMVTENPAKLIGIKNKGQMKIGYDADFTIFDIDDKEVELVDSNNNKVIAKKVINPIAVVLNGEYIDINNI